MAGSFLVACRHCDLLHERAPIEPGAVATCSRCEYVLYRESSISLNGWIALTLTAVLVFAIANAFPIVTLDIQGLTVEASLPGALFLTWQQGHRALAIMTGMFAFWLPLTQLLFTLWALLAIRSRRVPGDFHFGMRLLYLATPWSMVPVFMLGILVATVKFAGLATIAPGPGVWAFAVLTFLITGLSRLTALRLWRYAEDAGCVDSKVPDLSDPRPLASCACCGLVQHVASPDLSYACDRCGAKVNFRRLNPGARVWALLTAAAIIYIPANVLPVMRVRTATSDSEHTILGGVIELWHLGSWDLAVIVFIASVVVPMTKLMALTILMLNKRWRGVRIQRQRTRLYEFIEFIGQWSMLDVFVVLLMTAMANFPGLSQVIAGPGALSFGVVVILTMLAAMSYDPRRGWDRHPASLLQAAQHNAR